MSKSVPRRYLCNEVIYTDVQLAKLFKKTVEEVNERYDSGAPISIGNIPIVASPITEKQLMWIIGGKHQSSDGTILCSSGVPVDIHAYNALMAKQ